MRRLSLIIVLFCLLLGCGPSTPTPAVAPATQTLLPASTVAPTDTPLSPSPTTPSRQPTWWDDAVFYEVFVRSFYDSDGDGNGDLQGLIERLDYLNDGDPATNDDLGVAGLWLMPVFDSPSYHGYDVVDYKTINPDYGTNEDFQRLIDEAHKRGICVIIDLVLNHTSDQHPWFVASAAGPDAEYRDWYVWSDADPGYLGPWGQQVWHPKNGSYYYGVFEGGMPDLNLENPDVTAELYEVARFWLEEMGVDGFRLDAAKHFVEDGKQQVHTPETHGWLADFYTFIKSVNPDALLVGEVWDNSNIASSYVGGLDLVFEFSLAKAILDGANTAWATPLASAMQEIQRLYSEGGYATFLTNHDQNRVMDELSHDPDTLAGTGKAKLAATTLLTLPGVPFVYYGEEIGMTGSKPDELIRTPMQWTSDAHAGFTTGTPWEPVNLGHEEKNVAVQSADPDSLLNHYRTLIALRNNHQALTAGQFLSLQSDASKVYAFLRHAPNDRILVVVNFGDKPTSDYALRLNSSSLMPGDYKALNLITGTEVTSLTVESGGGFKGYQPQPELPARSALILELIPGEE
jgi:glycosidase